MVIYHLSTTYQLLYCICHRLSRNSEEESVLFVTEYILNKAKLSELIERLKKTKWFNEIYVIPESKFKLSRGMVLNEASSDEDIEKVIKNICNCFSGWNTIKLEDASAIYIGSDHWSFGTYCLYNKIPHIYIEDASGMLSQYERYMEIMRTTNITNYVISKYLNGAGKSPLEIYRLCDKSNFIQGFTDDRAEDFSIYKALTQEIPQKLEEILKFYQAEKISDFHNEKICMFMTQYLKSMAVRDVFVQERIFTLIADYFAVDCKLIIKPHPKDIWLNYRRIFPDTDIIPQTINSELIPFLTDRNFFRVITASSTSVGGIAPFADEVFSFETAIEKEYEKLHSYYACALIIKQTGMTVRINEVNIHKKMLENFLRILNVEENDFADLWVNINFGDCSFPLENTISIFFSTDFTDEKMIDDRLICVKINAEYANSNAGKNFKDKLYIRCSSHKLREKIKLIDMQRELKYSKCTLKITACELDTSQRQKLIRKMRCDRNL